MSDYISREAAKDYACDQCGNQGHCNRPKLCPVMNGIESIPAADVRPVVKARWKPVMCAGNPNIQDRDEWYGPLFVCDKCNWTMIGKSNFCPNCGADMREES